MTCRYKCGDACSKPVPNTSGNEYFGDIVKHKNATEERAGNYGLSR